MYKVLWLLKGQPGISAEQFRDWYENSHAVLAQRHFGQHLIAYRRNYVEDVAMTKPDEYTTGPETPLDASVADPVAVGCRPTVDTPVTALAAFDYLCVTEWVMPNEAAFDSIMRVFADPEIGALFTADSRPMLSPQTVLIRVTDLETAKVRGARTLAPGNGR